MLLRVAVEGRDSPVTVQHILGNMSHSAMYAAGFTATPFDLQSILFDFVPSLYRLSHQFSNTNLNINWYAVGVGH